MAKYLYGDREFPAIPTTEYQYAVIVESGNPTKVIYTSTIPTAYKSSGLAYISNYRIATGDAYATCEFDATTKTWGAVTEKIADGSNLFSTLYDIIWSNYDIYHADDIVAPFAGELKCAASDPIPVTTAAPIDPTSFTQGWLVGQRIRMMRNKPKEEA